MTAVWPTKASRDPVVERFSAVERGNQTLGRLTACLARA